MTQHIDGNWDPQVVYIDEYDDPFRTPDGIGRLWYDDLDELLADMCDVDENDQIINPPVVIRLIGNADVYALPDYERMTIEQAREYLDKHHRGNTSVI